PVIVDADDDPVLVAERTALVYPCLVGVCEGYHVRRGRLVGRLIDYLVVEAADGGYDLFPEGQPSRQVGEWLCIAVMVEDYPDIVRLGHVHSVNNVGEGAGMVEVGVVDHASEGVVAPGNHNV